MRATHLIQQGTPHLTPHIFSCATETNVSDARVCCCGGRACHPFAPLRAHKAAVMPQCACLVNDTLTCLLFAHLNASRTYPGGRETGSTHMHMLLSTSLVLPVVLPQWSVLSLLPSSVIPGSHKASANHIHWEDPVELTRVWGWGLHRAWWSWPLTSHLGSPNSLPLLTPSPSESIWQRALVHLKPCFAKSCHCMHVNITHTVLLPQHGEVRRRPSG
jgi:hypothetical protein